MRMMHKDAQTILRGAIDANMPEANVRAALKKHKFTEDGDIFVVAIGKAAWTMANAAYCQLGFKITAGIVITPYGYSKGDIPRMEIYEASHPLPDQNSLDATQKVMDMVHKLKARDEVVFLVSGGGSSLFEKPLSPLTLEDLKNVDDQLIKSGADIVEINMIRKRLSQVKAGRFARLCEPAKLFTLILSDVLSDRVDTIASGPEIADESTNFDALNVIKKYDIQISPEVKKCLEIETPKQVDNVEIQIIGSVRLFCESVAKIAESLGYASTIMTTQLSCHARDAGNMLAAIARQIGLDKYSIQRPCALIFGGETVVHVTGSGKGGRNQEIALAAAAGIEGLDGLAIFSIASDGIDGPTDVAGAIVDGMTLARLRDKKIRASKALDNNDSYTALKMVNSLIFTGPTGTNVNDVSVILVG
ncbi:MAG: glycerate kinase [Elusimicrobiota bacterium]|jgi:hydroxypyruvate reductase|nr:glycerate kinase [Elusimicrobiota bacterium]